MEYDVQMSCFFKDILETCNSSKRFNAKDLTATQKSTVIRCSQERQDNFIQDFADGIACSYHKDCYAEYTSRQKIERHLKKRKSEEVVSSELSSPSQKRLRRYVCNLTLIVI